MKEGLLTAWQLNNEKNLLLLRHLTDDTQLLRAGKGRTVGEQLVHLHNTRTTWTEFVAKPLYDKTLLLAKDAVPDLEGLKRAFQASAKAIAAVIETNWEKDGKLSGFKTGLIPFVTYLVSHESHHRGGILQTLKQGGVKLPDELKWGLWEWQKPPVSED